MCGRRGLIGGAQDSPTFTPNVFNSVIDGRPAFSSNDLLQRHPTKHHLFRVFGRKDDQLMLSTGEKVHGSALFASLDLVANHLIRVTDQPCTSWYALINKERS